MRLSSAHEFSARLVDEVGDPTDRARILPMHQRPNKIESFNVDIRNHPIDRPKEIAVYFELEGGLRPGRRPERRSRPTSPSRAP